MYRPPPSIGSKSCLWVVGWMFRVEVYLRVRRAMMVDGMSIREAGRTFGLHRDTIRKMLSYSAPPGYRRQNPPKRPKLSPFTGLSTGYWRTTSGVPGSSATRQSASSSGAGRVRVRRSVHHSQGLCKRASLPDQGDVRAVVPSAGTRPVRLRRGLGGHRRAWSERPTVSSWTCPTATGAS